MQLLQSSPFAILCVRAERCCSLSFGGEAVLVWLPQSSVISHRVNAICGEHIGFRLMWASAREKMELLFTRGLFLRLANRGPTMRDESLNPDSLLFVRKQLETQDVQGVYHPSLYGSGRSYDLRSANIALLLPLFHEARTTDSKNITIKAFLPWVSLQRSIQMQSRSNPR